MAEKYIDLKQQLNQVLDKIQDSNTDIDEIVELHKKGKQILEKLDAYLKTVEDKINKK